MKKILSCALFISAAHFLHAQAKTVTVKKTAPPMAVKPSGVILRTATDSFSYAVGMNVAGSLISSGAPRVNTEIFTRAINDVYNKKGTALTDQQANSTIQEKLQELAKKKTDSEQAEGLAFLAENKKRAGVNVLPDGLQYEILQAGEPNGPKPAEIDTVVVDYSGTLINGTEFDNSIKSGHPATFPLNGVIRGWTEILQHMPKGAKWKVYIPSELAYGANPQPGSPIPPNAVLIFEITLRDIKPAIKADH